MKILIIMDPGLPVPPPLYGGHERLVYMFAEEYIKLGHEVSLLAGPDSKISGRTYSFGINDLNRSKWQKLKELIQAWKFISKKHREFDLVHNFGRLAYLIPFTSLSIKKIMTYGRSVDPNNIKWINRFPNKNLKFTAPSHDCISTSMNIGDWTRVYNAVDFSKYNLTIDLPLDSPLIFLSRLDRVKGCHIAIEIAKATGNRLIIAGNISNIQHEIDYFETEIKPHIDDDKITYVGAVNDEQKNHYLGMAKALLFPIDTREAFGMVMAESMACGTPVIGFSKGSVPEVIENGINGFVVNNIKEMIDAIAKIDSIDRTICRASAEKRFDKSVIAHEYLTLF